jgi:hypothetical protein
MLARLAVRIWLTEVAIRNQGGEKGDAMQ